MNLVKESGCFEEAGDAANWAGPVLAALVGWT